VCDEFAGKESEQSGRRNPSRVCPAARKKNRIYRVSGIPGEGPYRRARTLCGRATELVDLQKGKVQGPKLGPGN